jgi:hypothetical protein
MLDKIRETAKPQDEQVIKAQAIILSLERMCTEARTRELHKDAMIAVLQSQLEAATRELSMLKIQDEAVKAKKAK